MKITVVGTGSISSVNNSPSYIIDNDIIIDMPNGNYKNIKRLGINPNEITNVLITHLHGDHFFDMPFYLFETLNSKEDIKVYVNKKGIKTIQKLIKLAFPYSYYEILLNRKYKFIDTTEFKIKDKYIEKISVRHGGLRYAYGYIITSDNKKVGFTGDSAFCKNVEKMAKVCNYLFCDCTYEIGNLKHMGIDNILYLAKKYPNCNVVVTHMSDLTKKKITKKKIKNIIIPKDGDIIEVN